MCTFSDLSTSPCHFSRGRAQTRLGIKRQSRFHILFETRQSRKVHTISITDNQSHYFLLLCACFQKEKGVSRGWHYFVYMKCNLRNSIFTKGRYLLAQQILINNQTPLLYTYCCNQKRKSQAVYLEGKVKTSFSIEATRLEWLKFNFLNFKDWTRQ